jgi:single-stranded-DNA-specific exonuclease
VGEATKSPRGRSPLGELAAAAAAEQLDVSVGLEVNQWNGALEPRVVLGKVYPPGPPAARELPRPDDGEWWERVDAELAAPLDGWPRIPDPRGDGGRRERVDRRGHGGIAAVAALASAGGAVLVLACDALRRRELVERAAAPARFGGGRVAVASPRLAAAAVAVAVGVVLEDGGVVLADWGALAADPALADRFEHVVAIDPPPAPAFARLLERGPGFLHLLWSDAHVDLACRAHEAEWPTRAVLAAAYRALRDGGGEEVAAAVARAALSGPGPHERPPEAAARCLRVLVEVGLVARGSGRDRALRVVSSPTSELERSQAYAAYRARSQEGIRFLSRLQAS